MYAYKQLLLSYQVIGVQVSDRSNFDKLITYLLARLAHSMQEMDQTSAE